MDGSLIEGKPLLLELMILGGKKKPYFWKTPISPTYPTNPTQPSSYLEVDIAGRTFRCIISALFLPLGPGYRLPPHGPMVTG